MKDGFKILWFAAVLLVWPADVPVLARPLNISCDQGLVSIHQGQASVASVLTGLAGQANVDIYIAETFIDYSKDLSFDRVPLEAVLEKLLKGYNYAVVYSHDYVESARCFAYTDADAFSPVGTGPTGKTIKHNWLPPEKAGKKGPAPGGSAGLPDRKDRSKPGKNRQRFASAVPPGMELPPINKANGGRPAPWAADKNSNSSDNREPGHLDRDSSGRSSRYLPGKSRARTGTDSTGTGSALKAVDKKSSTQTSAASTSDDSTDSSDTGLVSSISNNSSSSDSTDSDSKDSDGSSSAGSPDEDNVLPAETQPQTTRTAETDATASEIARLEYQIRKLEDDIDSGRAEAFYNFWSSKKDSTYIYSHEQDLAAKKKKLAQLKGE